MRSCQLLTVTSMLLPCVPSTAFVGMARVVRRPCRSVKLHLNALTSDALSIRTISFITSSNSSGSNSSSNGSSSGGGSRNYNRTRIHTPASMRTTAYSSESSSSSSLRRARNANLPLFYNDVYRVELPLGHRFPMEKYRLVREVSC